MLLVAFFTVYSAKDVAAGSTSPILPADSQDSEGNFSIIWITDTQYLSASHPTYCDSLCRWIVDNAQTFNVKMVVHTGDLVDDEFNKTQWDNADKSMSILLDNAVPYCWNAGNHDYNTTLWLGNQFSAFNPALMAQKTYWIGDEFDGENTAVHFTVSGWDFLIVNIAYQANDTVLTWANNLLDEYPQSHAIVATHAYLNRTGGYESWATYLKDKVLDTHANVFLTLGAHYYPTSGITKTVGGRQELMFNRQDKDSEMGAASARILTFDTTHGTIDVKTFYIYANTYLTDADNQFILDTAFRNDDAGKEETASKSSESFPTSAVLVVSVVIAICVLLLTGWRWRQRKETNEYRSK